MVGAMETFDEACGAAQQLTGGGDGLCLAPSALSCEVSDWRALYEAERVRADTLQFDLDRTRDQLKEARAEVRAARRDVKRGQTLAEALKRERDALKRKNAEQASELRKLRGTREKHAKARFGSKSEKRKKKAGTGNKRGQQPGKSGHGRTPRPKLEEKHERHDPPASQRTCPCCGEPYVANGSHETSIMEVHVKGAVLVWRSQVIDLSRLCGRDGAANTGFRDNCPFQDRILSRWQGLAVDAGTLRTARCDMMLA